MVALCCLLNNAKNNHKNHLTKHLKHVIIKGSLSKKVSSKGLKVIVDKISILCYIVKVAPKSGDLHLEN